ncbi:hypothetical protein NMG60_11003056 [Bertholletia excelsa]
MGTVAPKHYLPTESFPAVHRSPPFSPETTATAAASRFGGQASRRLAVGLPRFSELIVTEATLARLLPSTPKSVLLFSEADRDTPFQLPSVHSSRRGLMETSLFSPFRLCSVCIVSLQKSKAGAGKD